MSEWISVKDRLPELVNEEWNDEGESWYESDYVLALCLNRGQQQYALAQCAVEDGRVTWDGATTDDTLIEYRDADCHVTHWMPLPELPKEDDNDRR